MLIMARMLAFAIRMVIMLRLIPIGPFQHGNHSEP